MPYSTNVDLPVSVQSVLPAHAQEIYRAAFNSALREYKEEDIARKVAWAAVKKDYKKGVAGSWVKK